jgi:hypothetical protein
LRVEPPPFVFDISSSPQFSGSTAQASSTAMLVAAAPDAIAVISTRV